MRFRVGVGMPFICLMFAAANSLWAQSPRLENQSPFARADLTPVTVSTDDPQQRMRLEMARRGEQERQARMISDTEKLLTLAQELKDSVGKTNVNILSVEVLKKANEIEKLAHSVKEKMKGSN